MDLHFLRKPKPLPGLCGLYFSADKLILTHVSRKTPNDQFSLHFIESVPYQENTLKNTLKILVDKHQLNQVACSWIVNAQNYQLFLLDPPKVEQNEMKDALRWQIKDLIRYSPQDAAIDFTVVPSPYTEREKVYVAASERSYLQSIADIILESDLQLESIDIPEFSLRNINMLCDSTPAYKGLLILSDNQAELLITHENNLLLTQTIMLPIGFHSETPSTDFLTELQNGYTYCQSQQQLDLPKKLFISAKNELAAKAIGDQLPIETAMLSLQQKMFFEFVMMENFIPKEALIAIGGACRVQG